VTTQDSTRAAPTRGGGAARVGGPRHPYRMRRHALVTLTAFAVGLVLLPAGAEASGAPSRAVGSAPSAVRADTSLAAAQAQARALAGEVATLHMQAEGLIEDWAQTREQLDAAVTRQIQAEQAAEEAQLRIDSAADVAGRTASSLYKSGGDLGIYSAMIQASDIRDVVDQYVALQSVLRTSEKVTANAQYDLASAKRANDNLNDITQMQLDLQQRAQAQQQGATSLLARAQAKLDAANATVRTLVAAAAAAQDTASAQGSYAALAAAGQTPWALPIDSPKEAYAAVDRAIAEASAAPANPFAVGAIRDARQWLGLPYSAGGGGPRGPSTGFCWSGAPDSGTVGGECVARRTIGFDCSSLMQRIYSAAGYRLPRTSRQDWWIGRHVTLAQLKPGDLLFWAYNTGNPASIHHVALYIGHGLMIHSPHTGDHVRVAHVYLSGFIGATRPV